jgi:hypothetical protein
MSDVSALSLPADERYVDRRGLATLLSVHVSTVDRWVRDGMPSETWGRRMRRFLPSRSLAWLREQEYAANSIRIAPAPAQTDRGHGTQEACPVRNADRSAVPTEGRRP